METHWLCCNEKKNLTEGDAKEAKDVTDYKGYKIHIFCCFVFISIVMV